MGTGAAHFVIAGALGIVACSTSGPTSGDAGTDSLPLEPLGDCVNGWYTAVPVYPCADLCTISTPPPPECAQTDCQQIDVEGFLQGSVLIDVILYYSKTSATMSTVTDYVKRTYTVGDGGVQYTPGNWGAAQCYGGNYMVFDGYQGYQRAWTGLSSALDTEYASGATRWTAAPVP